MKNFYLGAKIFASGLLLGQNIFYAQTQPGPMDTINGAITGMVFYAIWFAREKK